MINLNLTNSNNDESANNEKYKNKIENDQRYPQKTNLNFKPIFFFNSINSSYDFLVV